MGSVWRVSTAPQSPPSGTGRRADRPVVGGVGALDPRGGDRASGVDGQAGVDGRRRDHPDRRRRRPAAVGVAGRRAEGERGDVEDDDRLAVAVGERVPRGDLGARGERGEAGPLQVAVGVGAGDLGQQQRRCRTFQTAVTVPLASTVACASVTCPVSDGDTRRGRPSRSAYGAPTRAAGRCRQPRPQGRDRPLGATTAPQVGVEPRRRDELGSGPAAADRARRRLDPDEAAVVAGPDRRLVAVGAVRRVAFWGGPTA